MFRHGHGIMVGRRTWTWSGLVSAGPVPAAETVTGWDRSDVDSARPDAATQLCQAPDHRDFL